MKKLWLFVVVLFGALAAASQARATLKVVTSTSDLASVAKSVGGSHVEVTALALPTQDPHWVDARPHLALDLARADLLVIVGADLEIGWLPTLQKGSRNGNIQTGGRGFLDASSLVALLEVPKGKVDRSEGDIHPLGNPHFMRDPRAVERVAVGIGKRLAELDPANKRDYLENTKRFLTELRAKRSSWEKRLAGKRGAAIVAYHRSWSYLVDWLGLRVVEHVEPRPGIPPNPRHVQHVIEVARANKVKAFLQESWFPDTTAKGIADKCGASLLRVPGLPDFAGGETYIAWMDAFVKRLAGTL